MEATLSEFQILRPRFERSQPELLEWLASMHSRREPASHARLQKLFSRLGAPDRIGSRGSEIPDGQNLDFASMEIYGHDSPAAGMQRRTDFYSKTSKNIFERFYSENSTPPSHLIHVTCTGYCAPSAAQHIVNLRNWSGKTAVTHAYHMGCYASLPSIRIAAALVNSGERNVDVVHSELCSLHMNLQDHSAEHFVINSLFADGHAKYTVSKNPRGAGLDVLSIREQIVPNTEDHMTWNPADWGMRMSLSKEVPETIAKNLKPFLKELLGERMHELLRSAVFAVHPGGPKIIDSIQSQLELNDGQVSHSKDVLFRYGNMSSATLPHVWKSILEDSSIESGREIVSLAFGPGLTIFGGHFRKSAR